MNWQRVALYALAFGACGAIIGAGLAIYTDEAWLSEDVRSLLTQYRANKTKEIVPNGRTEHGISEGDSTQFAAQASSGRSREEPTASGD